MVEVAAVVGTCDKFSSAQDERVKGALMEQLWAR